MPTPSHARLAVISDTHLPRGQRRLPEACVERLRQADLIIHAGDLSTRAVLDELEQLGPPVVAVHGNVDAFDLQRSLPARRTIDIAGARIGVIHDAGPSSGRIVRLRAAFPDHDAVIFGHSHIPLHESADGFQIFNPGSPTDRRREPEHTMGVATVSDGAVTFEHVRL
jgi:putative phosphoesterase